MRPVQILLPAVLALAAGPTLAADHLDAPILVGSTQYEPRVLGRVVVTQALRELARADIEIYVRRRGGKPPPIRIGETIRIADHHDPEAAPLFVGEVTALEPHFGRGRPTAVIHGFDRLHRLNRGRSTRTWGATSEVELVAAIAAGHGLSYQGSDPGFSSAFIYQTNQTDLEFLRARAARIGWLLHVDDGALRFEPPSLDPARALSFASGLRSFKPELAAAGQVGAVVVRGWDPVKKEPIVGEAGTGRTTPAVTLVLDHADPLSEEPVLSQGLLFSSEEATLVAKSALAAAAGEARSATGVARGGPADPPGCSGGRPQRGRPLLRGVSGDARHAHFRVREGLHHTVRASEPAGASALRTFGGGDRI